MICTVCKISSSQKKKKRVCKISIKTIVIIVISLAYYIIKPPLVVYAFIDKISLSYEKFYHYLVILFVFEEIKGEKSIELYKLQKANNDKELREE